MPDHDNTIPCRKGAYSLSEQGKLCYFPIEQAGYMRPAMALVLYENAQGEIMSRIEIIWPRDLNHYEES